MIEGGNRIPGSFGKESSAAAIGGQLATNRANKKPRLSHRDKRGA
jgi:hypothetical protein